MFEWNKWTWFWFLVAALGMAIMYCQPGKAIGQTQPDVLIDSHSNQHGNIPRMPSYESPIPREFNMKQVPKKINPPKQPRLVINPVDGQAKDDENGKQSD